MARKRKKLPENFEEIAKTGDLAQLQAVFEQCEINAYGGYRKGNALSFKGISLEGIAWLVAQGIDIKMGDSWGVPPIQHQARQSAAHVKCLLQYGADIEQQDNYQKTPLFNLVSEYNLAAVKNLIANGANLHAVNFDYSTQMTVLDAALWRCSNAHIPRAAEMAEFLLAQGAVVGAEAKNYVQNIGEEFEFYRADFDPDYLPEVEQGLSKLYQLFEVKPAAKRLIHDGKQPIIVADGTWRQQFNQLWEMLVPGSGSALTIQGEVIRIIGKVSNEILGNGGINWSKDYKKLPQALPYYFAQGNSLPEDQMQQLLELANAVSAHSSEELLGRLSELAVQWVQLNPQPMTLGKVAYKR